MLAREGARLGAPGVGEIGAHRREVLIDSPVIIIACLNLIYFNYNITGILIMHVYMDASGQYRNPGQRIVTMGGCIAPVAVWVSLEKPWKKILNDYNVSRLHMTDLMAFEQDFKRNKGWDERRRNNFLSDFSDVMDQHIQAYVGAVLPLDQWHELSKPLRTYLKNPYLITFQDCIEQAGTIAEGFGEETVIQVCFDDEPKLIGLARSVYEGARQHLRCKDRLTGIGHGPSMKLLPLQAADFLAYELNHLGHQMLKPERIVSPWLERFFKKLNAFEFYQNYPLQDRFENLISENGDKDR